MKLIFYILTFLFLNTAFGQQIIIDTTIAKDDTVEELFDSLTIKRIKSINLPFKIAFAFDARRSFYQKNNIKINGIKVSFSFLKRHRVGIGFHFLSHQSKINLNIDTIPNENNRLIYRYLSLSYEYLYFKKPWLEISSPIYIGAGYEKLFTQNENGYYSFLDKNFMLITEFSAFVRVNATRWIGIGLGAGYRFAFDNNQNVENAFNDWLYYYQIKLNFVELIKCFNKKQPWFGF